MMSAKLFGASAQALFSEVAALGAVDVAELSAEDWRGLPSWKQLRPLETRRLLAVIGRPWCTM